MLEVWLKAKNDVKITWPWHYIKIYSKKYKKCIVKDNWKYTVRKIRKYIIKYN